MVFYGPMKVSLGVSKKKIKDLATWHSNEANSVPYYTRNDTIHIKCVD